ncbi:MAG: arginase family protein [Desulfobacterales bacterium]|nr:MAG: arginase family protein [Desulfobacterales bacterium]
MRNRFIVSPFFLDEEVPELELLAQSDWLINKPSLPQGVQQTRMAAIHRPLADLVAQTVASGDRPVSVAGDCCTAIGVLAGLQRRRLNPTLVWFDAHGDFNTWQTTPSGFLGGMPLAMLVGRGDQTLANGVGLKPLSERQVILTDARDLDPGEREAVQASAVRHVAQVATLMENFSPSGPLYIHFDTDIVCPEDAPAMNYLAPGGPSAADLQIVFRKLARTGQVAAVSLSSWNPQLDPHGQTREVCLNLLQTLIEDDD